MKWTTRIRKKYRRRTGEPSRADYERIIKRAQKNEYNAYCTMVDTGFNTHDGITAQINWSRRRHITDLLIARYYREQGKSGTGWL